MIVKVKEAQKSAEEPRLSSWDALSYFNKSKYCIGWDLPSRDEPNWWIYYLTFFVVILMGYIYMPLGLLLTGIKDMNTFTITDLFNYLQAPVNSVSAIIKVIIIYLMKKRFLKVHKVMKRMDDLNSEEESRDAIQKCIVDCKKVFKIYQVIYYGYLVFVVVGALATNTTPYQLYNPFIAPSEKLKDLLIGNFMEGLSVFSILTANVVADVYPIMYVDILRTHIHLLVQKIKNLRSDPEKSENENYADLVTCVKAHRLIIEYVTNYINCNGNITTIFLDMQIL